MKKLTKLFSMLLVAAMSVMMVACDDPAPTPEPTPDPTPETTEPTVSVTPGEVGEDWISFTITTTNVKRAFYVAISEDVINDVTVDVDFVLSSPNMVLEPNTAWTTVFDGRTPNTKYYIYAAGFQGDKKVLSECVEMTTLAHQYSTIALPEADNCSATLTALSSVDRYAFLLTDDEGNLSFGFDLYTTAGCDGAIPTATYSVGTASVGCIDLNSISLEHNGLLTVISEGSMAVELYDDGKKIKLEGDFTLVTNDKATFSYDGDVTMLGIGQGGYDDGTIVFTRVPMVGTSDSEPGWYEIQFQPADDASVLDLQFYSDSSKRYLTSGTYPVFGSREAATAAGYADSWIYVVEGAPAGSFYQDAMMIPSIILTGTDSYVEVVTRMGEGVDYYEITFSLRVQSVMDGKESTLKAVYKGALGFKSSGDVPSMTMESMYVDVTSEGTTHTLNFHGGFTTMIVTVEGELPAVGDDYKWFDITAGDFSDGYAGVYNHPISNGRIAIKRFPDAADSSDDNKVKEYYGFKIEGQLEDLTTTDSETGVSTTLTYDLVGDWKSFETPYVSEWW